MRAPPLACAALAAALCALPFRAEAAAGRIEDNSFLIEEAYNQEPGVVHHISTYQRATDGGQWLYTFTEEWPLGGSEHQVSATLPIARPGIPGGSGAGLGDVALHYRFALFQDEASPLVSVVRVTGLLPTGDRARALGEGRPGAQLGFPVSLRLGERLVEHANLYGTWTPPSGGGAGARETTLGLAAGDGLVWLARPSLNLMVEALWTQLDRSAGGVTVRSRSFTVSPAFRASVDFRSGLQIVWGLGLPVGVGPSRGELGVFLYLSFEHPLRAAAERG